MHTFAAHVRARPELVWTALTDADKTAAYLHGLAAHSTQIPVAPISFCLGDRTELIGRILHAHWPRTAVVLRAASRAAQPAHVPDLADQADTGRVHDPSGDRRGQQRRLIRATYRTVPGWAAIRFVLRHPAVTAVVIGARDAAEVIEDVTNLTTAVPAELFGELAAEHLIPMAVDRS